MSVERKYPVMQLPELCFGLQSSLSGVLSSARFLWSRAPRWHLELRRLGALQHELDALAGRQANREFRDLK